MKKIVNEDFRVVVRPSSPGNFGSCFVSGITRTEDETRRVCEQIVAEVKRHVDCGSISLDYDATAICEHCGYEWTEKSDVYNGGCCAKDEENAPTEEHQS